VGHITGAVLFPVLCDDQHTRTTDCCETVRARTQLIV